MRIAVCVKQVLDPEIPARALSISPDGRQPVVTGAPALQVFDSYAENALELGLQLRDAVPGATLTAISVGDAAADEALRRALSLTADAAVRAWDAAWDRLDAMATAHIVARALHAMGGADIVLCGRQASDIEESVFGPALAEELGASCLTSVGAARVSTGSVVADQVADGTTTTYEVSLPTVLTVTSAPGIVVRMPKVKDAMLAKRKQVRVIGVNELGLDAERATPRAVVEKLAIPESDSRCEMIAGDARVQAMLLVTRLRELRVI